MSKRSAVQSGLQPLVHRDDDGGSDDTTELDDGLAASAAGPAKALSRSGLPPPGTLTRVRMINLRCHQHSELALAPRVNFICGLNGSGKSTILLAISLCLGSKIPATKAKDKGSTEVLKGHPVVRNDTNTAEVEIEMVNGSYVRQCR